MYAIYFDFSSKDFHVVSMQIWRLKLWKQVQMHQRCVGYDQQLFFSGLSAALSKMVMLRYRGEAR